MHVRNYYTVDPKPPSSGWAMRPQQQPIPLTTWAGKAIILLGITELAVPEMAEAHVSGYQTTSLPQCCFIQVYQWKQVTQQWTENQTYTTETTK